MSDINLQQKISSFLDAALAKFSVSDFNEAIRDLKAAEVLDKNNPEILYNLGISYSRLGLLKTAIDYFERLLNLPFTFVDILTVKKLLAYAFIKIDKYENAVNYLDNVIKISPSDTTARSMKGYCFEKKGEFSRAIKEYRSIIEIDTLNYNACNSLAYIMAKTDGNLDESLQFAKSAFESNKSNPAYLDTIGYIYMKKGDLETAEDYFQRALSYQPLSVEIKEHLNNLQQL